LALLGGSALLAGSAVLAGCGNSRTPVPTVTAPAAPSSFHRLAFRSIGLTLRAPRNWSVGAGKGSLVTTVSSGTAIVALWRYRRTSPAPRGDAALAAARARLLAEARGREPGLRLLRSRIVSVDGVPAVELDAIERIGGRPRRVRSLHVFRRRGELVLEEYAPAGVFRGVDRAVFAPLKRSLTLGAPAA
jgi:hypothetical protein